MSRYTMIRCDQCHKEGVTGYSVSQTPDPQVLHLDWEKFDWDFCSRECMTAFWDATTGRER